MATESTDSEQGCRCTVLPDGNGGFVPAPELLSEEEAIRWLRLDVNGPTYPNKTLQYYREKGLLKGVKVGKRMRYRVQDLRRFLAELAESQNV